jgi:uncharacterized protein YndB with AHSA1/START domain
MSKPKFVYVTYIASTPEKVFEALTSEKLTAQYWFGYALQSDWKVGSRFTATKDGGAPVDHGIILEIDPPHRLVYSWAPQYKAFEGERPSRVTFDLVPFNGQVQLTIVHDDFDEGSKAFESISGGWPKVLSSLKSFLETGKGLAPSWTEEDLKKIHELERAKA